MALRPHRPVSLVAETIDALQREVTSGNWAVGARIPTETELVEQLGVGRGTVREAVRALTYSGMLEVRRGYGTFVRSDTETSDALQRRLLQSDHHEVFEVRRALEVEGAILAAQRRTDDDLTVIEEALRRRTAAARKVDIEEFIAADIAFHQAVVRASHNRVLTQLYSDFEPKLSADLKRQCAASPEGTLPDVDHHSIVEAIRARDTERAAQAALRYLTEAEPSDPEETGVRERVARLRSERTP
ncbi:FadR/GntR family transcriptional regulator [Rhodococcus sp. SGAir0479]|uniref:FadR/GntR family transcriptional regulator n=1 Tax=Rhodococcus sp. SGAir0479 TaxID=2567884 RepID=UPI0010CCD9DB|nr:FadR/GntR family transcriptional regulator [Rhodococcus sp. SGAir0479]QCQ91118.1 FadR family transcriptional regulator [Rhodococcus sp. SGAir0479]